MTELSEEIQRDPGRFLKHLNTEGITTVEEFEEEMRDSLPERGVTKQRVVDRADILFGTDEMQGRVINNFSRKFEDLGTLADAEAVQVDKSTFALSSTFNNVVQKKATFVKNKNFELREILNQGDISGARDFAGRELTTQEQARAIVGREPSPGEIFDFIKEGRIS